MNESAPQRPISIAVISWILIVLGSLSLVTTLAMMGNPAVEKVMDATPLPHSVQYAMSFLGTAVMIGCGIAMLMGMNAGRWVYVGWNILGFVIALATSPAKLMLIPSLVVFLLIAFFLFRPSATEYFLAKKSNPQD
ncbi:MAG: hypothetical protein AB8C95_05115 [Phycisphaeraceae bacterium]